MDGGAGDGDRLALLRIKKEARSQLAVSEYGDGKASEAFPDIKSPLHIDSLPGEIIKRILSYLRQNTDAIYDDESGATELTVLRRFKYESKDYRSVALAGGALTPWAQEELFEAPVLSQKDPRRSGIGAPSSPFILLAQTLLERPDLSAKVRRLSIFLPTHAEAGAIAWRNLWDGRREHQILERIAAYINTLKIPRELRKSWTKKLKTNYPYPLIGVILLLVPNLSQVTLISNPGVCEKIRNDFLCDCFGVRSGSHQRLFHFAQINALGALESLIVRGPAPVSISGLQFFTAINNLHLRLEFHPDRRSGLSPTTIPPVEFRNVSSLRLDLQNVPKAGRLNRTDSIAYFGPLLAAFENLKHLDLSNEPRDGGRNDQYPIQSGLLEKLADASQLISLTLPKGFWLDKNVTRRFTGLQKLTASFETIRYGNPFPEHLEHLVIREAVSETIPFVLETFQVKAVRVAYNTIRKIELQFASPFTETSFEYLRTGVMFPSLWKEADAVGIDLTIAKTVLDDE